MPVFTTGNSLYWYISRSTLPCGEHIEQMFHITLFCPASVPIDFVHVFFLFPENPQMGNIFITMNAIFENEKGVVV